MVFLTKGEDIAILFKAICHLFPSTTRFTNQSLKLGSRFLLQCHLLVLGPLLLNVLTNVVFIVLRLELLGSLQLSQISSLSIELSLLDHFPHEDSLSLYDADLKLHVIKLSTESKAFQRYVLLGQLNAYPSGIVV